MTLLEQLRLELPENSHRRRVYYSGEPDEVARLVQRARELNLVTVKYLLTLEKFEERPPDGDPKQAAFDTLIAVLAEISPALSAKTGIEQSRE